MENDNGNQELNGTFARPSTVMDDWLRGTAINGDIIDYLARGFMNADYDHDYDENNDDGDGPDGDAYFRSLPPGFRFRPTDEELTKFYFENKLLNRELPRHRIFDVNIYEYHPKTLSETYEKIREDGWYFFTSRNKKYPKGSRPDRAAHGGFWKPTGIGKSIPSKDNELWIKNSLDFYDGNHKKPNRSEWKMHEFALGEKNVIRNKRTVDGTQKLDDIILCRIYLKKVANNKNKNKNKNDEGETGGSSCDKSASAESNLESSDHNNNFSTLVIDEDKLNSTTPACSVQEVEKHDNHTSYMENSARYQAHPMNNNQNSSFTPVVDEDNRKIPDHSYNLLPSNSATVGTYHDFVPQQESGKQVWYDNNTYIENPADHSYNLLPFNSAEGLSSSTTGTSNSIPKQESGKQVSYGNNTYIENPAPDQVHPMNKDQHMILSSMNPKDTMNQLAQPSMVSNFFTDDYIHADFLSDTFLADYLPQLDEEMWLDDNRPK